ncbi:hypothetical protein WA026_010443 [Henosepilachna vigintioctopunctata]|uniref:GDNF/GAS1 domain-containing protein n=1 Tax=Henosepilachna vigintioctopunctata TaxID=420089 RepID=A0AAW1V5M7_9CUCU
MLERFFKTCTKVPNKESCPNVLDPVNWTAGLLDVNDFNNPFDISFRVSLGTGFWATADSELLSLMFRTSDNTCLLYRLYVACSTVTVTKCQAALRTLQAFPFFKPTCLCKPPQVDPECNTFRDFLFDHPCVFVLKKEKDPYPVDALPTCNHALSVCQQERKCIKLYEDFKSNCKVRDNKCRMEDRDSCHEAWSNLRRSPMFGCICPNNHMKKRCDRIFSMVNHNPCVDTFPVPTSYAQTPLESTDLDMFKKTAMSPSGRYPHLFLLVPPTHGTAMDTYRTQHTFEGTGTGIDSDIPAFESLDTLRFPELVEEATNNASTSFDYGLGNAIVENPLVDAANGHDAHHDHDHISVSVLKNRGKMSSLNFSQYPEEDGATVGLSTHHLKYQSTYKRGK